jgi:energy-coupling factor transport system ATP-binding protein
MALWMENFYFAYPGDDRWTLQDISMGISPGKCHCLTGATGSGKSTLALALKGLLPPGRKEGRLRLPSVPDQERAGAGLVLQNPETQLLTETIGSEIAFGLENLCLSPQEMPARVEAALAAADLALPLDHPTERLSMGQKYRLLIAAQLVMDPALLILDEPVGQLDPQGLRSLSEVIAELKRSGVAVLICEHSPEPLAGVIDHYWQLRTSGSLLPGRRTSPMRPLRSPRAATPPRGGEELLRVRGLSVDGSDSTPAWSGVSFHLERGQRAALCAPNGAGKTTLLRCLTGFLPPSRGEIKFFGEPPAPDRLRGRMGYLFQNPGRQLFETTVFDEVAFSLRRCGSPRAEVAGRVERILSLCGISGLAGRSPHQLSYGQKHLVALAAVLAPGPQLLLLDDPFAGLDAEHAATVIDLLVTLSEEQGTALLWTSHDETIRPDWVHLVLGIEGGCLVSR